MNEARVNLRKCLVNWFLVDNFVDIPFFRCVSLILSKEGKIRKKVNSQVWAPISLRSNKSAINVYEKVLATSKCQAFTWKV